MKRLTPTFLAALALTGRVAIAFTLAAAIATATLHAAQAAADEPRALRARIEQRYDVVPLSRGVALRPMPFDNGTTS